MESQDSVNVIDLSECSDDNIPYSNSVCNTNEEHRRVSRCNKKYLITLFLLLILLAGVVGTVLLLYFNNRPIGKFVDKTLYDGTKYKDVEFECVGKDKTECKKFNSDLRKKYVDELVKVSESRKVKLYDGNYNSCNNSCIYSKCVKEERCVYKWELESVSRVVVNNKLKINAEFELDTLLKYKRFIVHYRKKYYDQKDFEERYDQFRKSRISIDSHNALKNKTYTKGYTTFADLTDVETGLTAVGDDNMTYICDGNLRENHDPLFGDDLIGTKVDVNIETNIVNGKVEEELDETKYFDWRKRGNIVGEVMSQHKCGSCWAVATIGVVESYMAIKTGSFQKYSVQQVVDCTDSSFGCERGGNHYVALEYVKKSKLCTEYQYPYVAKTDTCSSKYCDTELGIKEVVSLRNKDAKEHLRLHGPFLTSFKVSRDFLLYESGIFNGPCNSYIGHSVTVVGYGHDKELNKDYWIIKNSWGKRWGENGYVKLYDGKAGVGTYCDFSHHAYGVV